MQAPKNQFRASRIRRKILAMGSADECFTVRTPSTCGYRQTICYLSNFGKYPVWSVDRWETLNRSSPVLQLSVLGPLQQFLDVADRKRVGAVDVRELVPSHWRSHRHAGPSACRVRHDRSRRPLVPQEIEEDAAAPFFLRESDREAVRVCVGKGGAECLRELADFLPQGCGIERHDNVDALAAGEQRKTF